MSYLKRINKPLALCAALLSTSGVVFANSTSEVNNRLIDLAAEQARLLSDRLSMEVLLEIESFYTDSDSFSGEARHNIVLATAELVTVAKLTDSINANFILVYEGGDGDPTGINVDVASLKFSDVLGADLLVGRHYLPFGAYETNMVNDTLLHELVEVRRTIAMVSKSYDVYSASLYIFEADISEQTTSYGLSLNAEYEHFSFGADYISNVAETGGVYGMLEDLGYHGHLDGKDQRTAGLVLRGQADFGGFKMIVESFQSDELTSSTFGTTKDVKPKALHIEFSTEYKGWVLASAFQRTDGLMGMLARERASVSAGTAISDNTSIIAELWRDKDYSLSYGGTAKNSHSASVQVAFEF